MPQMGVSVSEGTIVKWLKNEGDPIQADEALLEISTDKVDTEVPSPGSGIVQQIIVHEGETVDVGTKLATIAPEGAIVASEPESVEPPAAPAVAEADTPSGLETPVLVEPPVSAPAAPAPVAPVAAPSPVPGADGGENGKTFVSPVVARIADEHGVDVGSIAGTGRGGRVTKKDILGFVEAGAPMELGEAEPAEPIAAPEVATVAAITTPESAKPAAPAPPAPAVPQSPTAPAPQAPACRRRSLWLGRRWSRWAPCARALPSTCAARSTPRRT